MCDILFTVNYCLFANGDVSIRSNAKDDNVVLEFVISKTRIFDIKKSVFIVKRHP